MKDYISAHGTVSEKDLLSLAEQYMRDDSIVYAVHTDSFFCQKALNINVGHLMEMRIFTEHDEIKLTRMNIGTDFIWRYIDDTAFEKALAEEDNEFLGVLENRVYDEEHYLDVDLTKSSGTNYTTTGGGPYSLPVEKAEKVRVRNYLEYDDNGIVVISDFRIVGFTGKGCDSNA